MDNWQLRNELIPHYRQLQDKRTLKPNKMKQFVIGGLDTPEKKQEAEAILKELGYESDESWNYNQREDKMYSFIAVYKHKTYSYHNHDCKAKPITFDELRTMKNQEK